MPRHDNSSLLARGRIGHLNFLVGTLPLPRNGRVADSTCIAGLPVRRPMVYHQIPWSVLPLGLPEPMHSSTLKAPGNGACFRVTCPSRLAALIAATTSASLSFLPAPPCVLLRA